MHTRLILAVAGALALSACGSSDDTKTGPMSPDEAAQALSKVDMPQPGQYKTSVEVLEFDIPGMPDAQKQQMKQMMEGSMTSDHTYCLTPEDTAEGPKDMAKKLAQGDCTFNDFKAGGNSLYADMTCKGAEGENGNVKLAGTMSDEGSDMTMTMTTKIPSMPGDGSMTMKMHMVSQRVGDCPAS